MPDRRKRARTSLVAGVDPLLVPTEQLRAEVGESSSSQKLQDGQNLKLDGALLEGASSVSKCSVKLISEVVSKFNEFKKDLVRAIGFDGILFFPHIKNFNRKFILWLMTSVNPSNGTINIGTDICIKFDKMDIRHVFGIPAEGKAVSDPYTGTREARDKVIQQYLGIEFKENRSIKIVQEIIERDYGSNMGKIDADRFKVAFVVFVVSNLLAPSAKHDYASVDYWNAIQDPDDISRFDWAEFVFSKLIEGVTKLKQDIGNNIKFPNITGCVMFLQVLYLDSLDIVSLSMPHTVFPRVREFTFDRLRAMILADQNFKRHIKGDSDLCPGKLRNPAGCIYSWAAPKKDTACDCRASCMLSTWESALAFVKLMNMPLEAAGPLFIALSNSEGHPYSGLDLNAAQATRFFNAVASLCIPHIRGCCLLPSNGLDPSQNGNYLFQAAISNGARLVSYPICNNFGRGILCSGGRPPDASLNSVVDSCLESGQHSNCQKRGFSCIRGQFGLVPGSDRVCAESSSLNLNLLVARTIKQFFSSFLATDPPNDYVLNAAASSGLGSSSYSSISSSDEFTLLSPWQLGYSWDFRSANIENFTEQVNCLEDDPSLAIVHRKPKYIQVSMASLALQLFGKIEMEVDMFDALVRLARQIDDSLFSSFGTMRWRCFFESDFMFGILSGVFDLSDQRLCSNLCINDTVYDFSQTKIVFFPALLESQWVCFAWMPRRNVIYVFEPSYCLNLPDRRLLLIERSCIMLKLALKTLTLSVFRGVCKDVTNAHVRMMHLSDTSVSRTNYSGVLCSMYYRCFDGFDLVPKIDKVIVEGVAAKLFYEIRGLKENCGTLNCRS